MGDKLRGKVTRVAPFGAFVELEEGIEGLCHVSEFEDEHGRSEGAKLEVGSEFEFRVIRLNARERKIALSMKELTVLSGGNRETQRTGEKIHHGRGTLFRRY